MNNKLKEAIIIEAGIAACKILATTFKMCELNTHIEQMFIDDTTGEEYILKFYSKDGFDRFVKQNESKTVKLKNDPKWICPNCGCDYVNSNHKIIGQRICNDCGHTWQRAGF